MHLHLNKVKIKLNSFPLYIWELFLHNWIKLYKSQVLILSILINFLVRNSNEFKKYLQIVYTFILYIYLTIEIINPGPIPISIMKSLQFV